VNLSDAEKERLINVAPRDCRKGRVDLDACPMCGKAEWRCTNGNNPDELILNVGHSPCDRCREVNLRAPEVTQWLLDVIAWRERLNVPVGGSGQ